VRKFFFYFGVVMAVVVVAAAVGFFFLARNGAALDAESKAYADKSVAAITDDWDAEALWRLSSPSFRQVTREEALRSFFGAAREKFGRLVAADSATGQATISIVNAVKSIRANYTVHARFEKGAADLKIGMIKNDAGWLIEGFHIDAAQLLRKSSDLGAEQRALACRFDRASCS
jgi:hypothetical protein